MDDQILLQELNLSSLRPTTLVKGTIRVDKQAIFVVFPDTNLKIWNEIYNTGMLLTNCQAIISPAKRFTIGRRKFNAKLHQLELKKQLLRREGPGKKLRVVSTIPINLRNKKNKLTSAKPKSQYFFYDASVYSDALKYLADRFSGKMLTTLIFQELSSLYVNLKSSLPTSSIELLILIKNNQGQLADLIKNLHIALPEKNFSGLKLYDNFTIVSNTDKVLLPIAFKRKGNNQLYRPNISRIEKFLEAEEIKKDIDQESVLQPDEEDNIDFNKGNTFVNKLVKSLRKSNLKTNVGPNGDVKIGLDPNTVTKILKKNKINDPDIAINVKSSIDAYMNEKGDKLTTDEAENVVMKAINYTVHGTDEISDEYIAKPQLLFNKLKEIKTYRVPLSYPAMDYIINPKASVDIDHTTGQFRQKFEFEEAIHENVRNLFKSIEDVKEHPIRVKKVEWNLEDNMQDRVINYKVTLQNLTGENKKPYVAELKVPATVNDKYFKLHGSSYIIASQQFMKPVTKTDKNEVRILSNYAIIRIGIKNLKFNPGDVDEIIDKYIKIRYPNLIKKQEANSVVFRDGSIINFIGSNVYESTDRVVTIDSDTGKLLDQDGEQMSIGKNEFIYEIILEKISKVNPQDTMYRTKKSVPFMYIYLSGMTIPLIIYQWSQKGLLTSLNDFGIDYEFSNTDKLTEAVDVQTSPTEGYIFVPSEDRFLAIKPKSTKEKLIVNGILVGRIKKPFKNLDDPSEIEEHISNVYGSGAVYNIHNMTENMIDPVTKELLEFENLPTKLPNLISSHCVPMLMNKKPDSLSDLKIYRSRMSEMVLQSMYKQIKQAHTEYKNKVSFGDAKAQLWLDKEYIIRDMITDAGVLQHTEPVTPVDEIMLASRVIKSGRGGVQSKQMFKVEQRNIHPSQYGIISANSTPEGGNVGIINRHTLTPVIVNKYGSYGAKDITGLSGWNTLSIEEALVPFQNEMDSERLVMAATHQGQVTPIENSEAPLVGTGAEFIVPQLSSSRFAHKAKFDGKVIDVQKGKTITVKYRNNEKEIFDITPRLSRTKMGAYISLEMNTLKENETFKKNQLVGFTKNFTKDSRYASGKNVFVAIMNPSGYGHEDAYAISQEFSQSASRDMVKEIHAIIPPDVKIINLVKTIGEKVEKDQVLIEFVYQQNLDDYLEINNLMDDNDEEIMSVFGSGDNSIKLLAQDGEIIDIKVYINNRNLVDPQIVTFHKTLVAETRKTIGNLAKNVKVDQLKSVDNIDVAFFKTGGHKYKQNEFQGARIVYYIKQKKPLIEGDKIANRYGAKGVIGKVFDKTPYCEITPRVDVFISPIGVFSRKNIAMIKELYLGKVIYYLNHKCTEWANNPKVKTDKIVKMVLDVYKLLSTEKVYKNISDNFKNMTEAKLRKMFKNEEFNFYILIEPFKKIEFKDIKTAADHLDIKLDEKVYIPELESWTENPVPVGVAYYNALEQFSEIYANVRGTGMYQGLTRQPSKGKSKQGGQSIGSLDMNALLTYNVPSIRNELFTLRSDDHRSKRLVNSNIITQGQSDIPKESGRGGTSQLLDVFITGMGLEII